MCRGIVVDQPVLGEIVGIVSPGVQDANSGAVSVRCGGTGCLFIDPDSLRAAGTTRTRNTARPWDFDGRDVLPLPIESRRTNQIKIIHTQPTPAPHETSAAHRIGTGSSAVTAA